nr:hypothetical protein [Tissierella sp.]
MIKAYVTCISTMYEGEDIEIRYSIFRDEELLEKKFFFAKYTKPALCNLVAVEKLLEDLEVYREEEIEIVVNDGFLFEILNGTSQTKKQDVQRLGGKLRKVMASFDAIRVENVSGDHLKIKEWDEILTK